MDVDNVDVVVDVVVVVVVVEVVVVVLLGSWLELGKGV